MSVTVLAKLVRSRSVILGLCPSAMRGVPEPKSLGALSVLVLVVFGRQAADTSVDEFVAGDNDALPGAVQVARRR